ncbi:MAG: SCP2 sterol-binding domain-containing protein [Myxococcales bacterium]|nr:SCP2 sterol-binding domain-containing protein [Myxococcales bacterium]
MSWLDTLEQIRTRDFRKASAKERDRVARDVVNLCSYACAAVAVSPLPFSDALLMLPIQSAMVMTVGHVYGRKLDSSAAKDLILELGAVAGVGFLARQGIKALLPVVGALLTVPAAFAASWGIGRVAMEYFKSPGATKEYLGQVFDDAKREAASLFSRERFERFRAGVGRKSKRKDGKLTVAQLIEREIPERLSSRAELAERVNAVVHFDIAGPGGGQWTLDLTRKKDWVALGLEGVAAMTVRCKDRDLLQIAAGKKDPQEAVLSGELSLEPLDLDLAQAIGELLV